VTDPQGHAAATSLVTAGTVLLGSVLLAAGCASDPALATASDEYLAIAQPAWTCRRPIPADRGIPAVNCNY
jgi:hypothetical protein